MSDNTMAKKNRTKGQTDHNTEN